ncbi:DNA polymerase III subunit alpha [Membranihabitans maritimus]|uniref:DNA polymerase III subunit alpha n=1 Tax=Membranihabitans maritimus TaxID=2904244 RepID=UPI001F02CFE0|nr:DNA polymerase III subunit alpha [Membranihabitans maritimus]
MFLNCHSYYSLRYGTLSPKELADKADALGIHRLVLTDINNTSGVFEFYKACYEEDDKGNRIREIEPIVGIEFRQGNEFRYLGIARDEEGFRELNTLLSAHLMEHKPLPSIAPAWKHAYVIYRSLPKSIDQFSDNEFYGIRPSEAGKLYSSDLVNYLGKLVVFSPVTFHKEHGYRTHKLLRCIDENIILGQLKKYPIAAQYEYFHAPVVLREKYKLYPRIIENTEALLDQCSIAFPEGEEVNRQYFTESRDEDFALLRKLALQGCERRYRSHSRAMKRVEQELSVIQKLGYATYFLITWDIIRYAHNVGYYHVGRGSGANSIVAYCMRITDVDPLELDLYFERFINQHRTSPPDFDIDFSWDERDHVTDYVFKRYGRDKTALLATYSTFKRRSVIRELGKVFGLPKADIDKIVTAPHAADEHHPYARHIFYYSQRIEGLPNYLSIHAGGILISERSLFYHTALQMMPKGFPIVQVDMYTAEDMGFHKYDILSQRGLGHIKEAVDLIRENKGCTVDIRNVSAIKSDRKVRDRLRSGQCIGCFYIESPAMRGLLTKLQCDDYLHLVAASSIIRPGVAKSGMMREYIYRFHYPESIQYLHPIFEEHLGETYGVMVYQEDVMKIVHHFAGLDLDESDVLRRIMSGKRKKSDTFLTLQEKFFRNCQQRGYSDELTAEVWRQVESFSGYSFCKAHSASFAVESFQSLYLKVYHPLEFMVAVINNFGGFYRTELYVHEARMSGGNIHPPCINRSRNLTHLYGEDIYLGFIHLRELEKKTVRNILDERRENGSFRNLEDFVNRVPISDTQLNILIRIGAFRFTGLSKYELTWESGILLPSVRERNRHPVFFDHAHEAFTLPKMEGVLHEQAFDEIELLGFPLCSPFDLQSEEIPDTIAASDFLVYKNRTVRILGYYVCQKKVSTVNRKLMAFGTWIDREGRFFDTTHFPPALEAFPFQGIGLYLITGKIVLDFDFPSVEVTEMRKIPYIKDGRY